MALSASGQWLVDAGIQLRPPYERAAWSAWVRREGWSPTNPEPRRVPFNIALIAIGALNSLIIELTADLTTGRLSDDEELDTANDLDLAKSAAAALAEDAHPS